MGQTRKEVSHLMPVVLPGGAYLHGVPVNYPDNKLIEYSWTLGTTPRSHMCVRNATSHAKFMYDWAEVEKTLVIVFD